MTAPEHDVAAFDDLADGGMSEVELDGQKILLARDGQSVHAIAGTCPHAGAPLAQGVRHGDRVICPWHKAAFCLRTGAVLEPPALDPLARFQTRIEGGRVKLAEAPRVSPATSSAEDSRRFVIVGAGAAGAVAAQTLREVGFAGRIILLDRENRVPYDRTVLSKYFLSGEKGSEKSPLQTQAYYREHAIERRTADIVHVDATRRRIACRDGSTVDYDAALLASGGTPRRPNIPGADLAQVFLLRRRSDAEAILAQAERSERGVVIGASFIGMEVAASLRERGLDVTVIGQESAPFEKQLGAEIGAALGRVHEKRGVSFRFSSGVAAIEGKRRVERVRLDSGEQIAADLVVIGAGVSPVTSYVEGLTMSKDGGIVVDAQLKAADGLYAAGDIASFPYRGDGSPIRVEHWRVAEQHGRIAALNMAGRPTRYDAVPVFWTIAYLQRLDYIGHATSWDEIVVHGDLMKPEFLAYYVKDGRVAAAAGYSRDQDTAALIELMSVRRDWTAAELGEHPTEVLQSA